MQLVDTHCHIHEILGAPNQGAEGGSVTGKWHKAGITTPDPVLTNAREAGVDRMICVGCTLADSQLAVEFVQEREGLWASIGLHPHEARNYVGDINALKTFAALASQPKVIAVGECGLDYYYNHSSGVEQEAILRFQIEVALENNLPMIFHVRDAFDDFWPIFDSYQGIRGVIHSFSATEVELEQILKRDLYVGLNGIMTFTKDQRQLTAARSVPAERLLLETDAPFLTPAPYRGTIAEPKYVRVTAEFLAQLRGEHLTDLAARTTANAQTLFGL